MTAGPAATPAAAGRTAVAVASGRRDLDAFLKLPWSIYRDDPAWVPPLLSEHRKVLDRERHPFHAHADVEYFLARRAGRVVGRSAAIINHQHLRHHGERCGFFGAFEAHDEDAARALFEAAEQWVRARGMERIRGPMNFSTNDELCGPGFLIDGFDSPPWILMAHTPPAYARWAERAGYAKAHDLYAYMLHSNAVPPRLLAASERAMRGEVTLRTLDTKRFDEEVALVIDIYNQAWEQNWGFVPLTPEELRNLARELKPILKPTLCLFAEAHGETVGFGVALPDINQALRHVRSGRLFPFGIFQLLWHMRRIDQGRVLALGVKPGYRNSALSAVLYARLFQEGAKLGMQRGEASWILEDNWPMRRALERMGGTVHKTYRVFEKAL